MKTIALLGVSIRMMARVLAQMIEGLCILKNSAGSLIQSQEFIQLSLNPQEYDVSEKHSGIPPK